MIRVRTFDAAVLSHSSKHVLKPFSLLLPTLSYSNIDLCIYRSLSLTLSQALDAVLDFMLILLTDDFGGWEVERDWERERGK